MVAPASKKRVVTSMKKIYKLSERTSCRLVGVSRTAYRYQPECRDDDQLHSRMRELATQYPRYGYLMLHSFLKQEGLVINRKRTYRVYSEEGLQVRTKKRKKLVRPRLPMVVPIATNVRWSMGFVSDQLSSGRRFRVLNIVDDYSREMVGQLTAYSITGNQVARFLNKIAETRTLPDQVICDNETEFTSKAMFFWQQENNVKLGFVQPDKPTQNAFVESLNGKFRNECLNQHWFRSLEQAIQKIDHWQHHYNTERPHSSLKYMTPVAFANKAA